MVVDQTIAEHELFGYSTTTTAPTTEDEHGCNWKRLFPHGRLGRNFHRNQKGEDHDRHRNLPSVTVRRICSRVSNVAPYLWRRAHRLELLTDKLQPSPACERRAGNRDGRYKVVRMRKWGKWVAEVRQPNSRDRIWLGSYRRAEEAARAYDATAFCLRGPSATLNFSDCLPDKR